MIRKYSDLIKCDGLLARYNYLKLSKQVGLKTFGSDRYLNQSFYQSAAWKRIRDIVIIRDQACDLGLLDFPISGKILIHHMNPMLPDDVKLRNEDNLNPQFLIATSERTHQAIHYGDISLLPSLPVRRFPGDTKVW